jgi:tRNA pseudouridine38-40 synthase
MQHRWCIWSSLSNRCWAVVEYDGTAYEGFQIQPGRPTIQAELERAVGAVTGCVERVTGAGRTDTGVHALGQVVHFQTNWDRPLTELQRALNAVLPRDIAVKAVDLVAEGFHARRSALSREYRFVVVNTPVRSPLAERYAYHVAEVLDEDRMQAAGRRLVGRHDFAALGSAPRPGGHTVRTVLWVVCRRNADHVLIDVCADAFLRRMVRRMAGLLVEAGAGRLTPEDITDILDSRDPNRVKWTLPPNGLCLVRVNYDLDDKVTR